LRDAIISCFCRTPTCDRRIDTRTQGQSTYHTY